MILFFLTKICMKMLYLQIPLAAFILVYRGVMLTWAQSDTFNFDNGDSAGILPENDQIGLSRAFAVEGGPPQLVGNEGQWQYGGVGPASYGGDSGFPQINSGGYPGPAVPSGGYSNIGGFAPSSVPFQPGVQATGYGAQQPQPIAPGGYGQSITGGFDGGQGYGGQPTAPISGGYGNNGVLSPSFVPQSPGFDQGYGGQTSVVQPPPIGGYGTSPGGYTGTQQVLPQPTGGCGDWSSGAGCNQVQQPVYPVQPSNYGDGFPPSDIPPSPGGYDGFNPTRCDQVPGALGCGPLPPLQQSSYGGLGASVALDYSPSISPTCVDTLQKCEYLVATGKCGSTLSFVSQFCPRSCGTCEVYGHIPDETQPNKPSGYQLGSGIVVAKSTVAPPVYPTQPPTTPATYVASPSAALVTLGYSAAPPIAPTPSQPVTSPAVQPSQPATTLPPVSAYPQGRLLRFGGAGLKLRKQKQDATKEVVTTTPGVWSEWSAWGPCRNKEQFRSRVCNYEAVPGAAGCAGPSYDRRACDSSKTSDTVPKNVTLDSSL